MSNGEFPEFLTSSAMKETMWYVDPDSKQLVCFCESCGAEARCTTENPEEFQFAHRDSCPHSDEKRTQRVVLEMITVLEQETDRHVAFSAIIFLAVSMCAMVAEEVGVPLRTMTNRFAHLFEERIHDVGPFTQLMCEQAKRQRT